MVKNQENFCQTQQQQVLILPFPLPGHINPMLQFSKRLVSKGLEVTLVTFSAGNKALAAGGEDGPVKIELISDDLSEHHCLEKPGAYLERLKEVVTLRLPQIIAKLGISCLVYDSVFPWALDIAKQQGLVGAPFFTQSCAVNTIYYNVHEGFLKIPLAGDGRSSFSFPGLPVLGEYDLPSLVYDAETYPVISEVQFNQFSNFGEADWVLINTFTTLEEEVYIYACILISYLSS